MKQTNSKLWLSAAVSLLCGGVGTAYGVESSTPPGGGAPPAAAIDACGALAEGASCSFQAPDQTISGICSTVESSLACTPADGAPTDGQQPQLTPTSGEESQPQPSGGEAPEGAGQAPLGGGGTPPTEALTACEGLGEGAACGFDTPNGAVSGSCAPVESQLSCVPEGGETPPPTGGEPTGSGEPQEPGGVAQGPADGQQGPAAGQGRHPGFRPDSNDLFLPEIDAGGFGSFSLSLRLEGTDPITLSLDTGSIQPVESSGQRGPVFDPEGGGLTIPQVQIGDRWYSAELRQTGGGHGYRFELVDLTETDAPEDAGGVDDGGVDGGVDGEPVGTVGVASGYPIVDTGQVTLYGASGTLSGLQPGDAFYGQDGNYAGNSPSYTDNGDGTVTDNVTGLMWQKSPDFTDDGVIDSNDQMSLSDALDGAATFNLAGYDDWRLPTIKELYSLMDFRGATGTANPGSSEVPADAVPYLDTDYFDFAYGDTAAGARYIDAQYWSSTVYGSVTMGGNPTAFGVNFADGRIKGYPYGNQAERGGRYIRYVRGNADYGNNLFGDNGDGTVSDRATGLMWLQSDSGDLGAGDNGALNWEQALAWCEGLEYAGYDDWRLPNVKELQSLVDYSRAPDTTNSAAIDPLFSTTLLADGINSSGVANYPYYWSGTTHDDGPQESYAAYVAFGEARGYFNGELDDVHGAGAQRSDPKSGDPSPYVGVGHGPQGDVVGIDNFARCVRNVGDV